jgi:hypothetical protein
MTRRAPHRGQGPGHADGPKAAVPQPPPSARLPPPPLALVSRGTSPSRAPGHRWRRPPAVTTGDPAGQRSPSAPGPRATVAPPSQPPRQNPSVVRACCQAGRVLSLPGRRVLRAPAGETREKRHTERMRPPRPRAPFKPDSAREGRLGSLRSRWSRSRSLRTCNWRSSSVVPPQTPCTWCVARAYCRHWRRTRHAPQTSFALAISPAPGPCALTGKNSSGSASRQAADRHQSRRSSASATR